MLWVGSACGDTGQVDVIYPIVATTLNVGTFEVDGWTIVLDEAVVAFGPLYLCATRAASASLCPAAVAEWREVATVDLLARAPVPLGEVVGVSGSVGSATWDYGIRWPTTQGSPVVTEAAPNGHSAVFAGRAELGNTAFDFTLDIDVVPALRGSLAVQGVPAEATIEDSGWVLEVEFDLAAWWQGVDFDALAERGEAMLVLAPDGRDANAVIIAMTANARPVLRWKRR